MPVDAEEALRRATLIRSDPSLRGVSRRNIATEEGEVKWEYIAPDGDPIEEEDRIQRWNSMGLPPAWVDVWICPNPRGHIQATGRDVKGRLQYRYHPDWTEITTEMKYDDVAYFASQLPRLRRQVARDIDAGDMRLDTVAALVVRLMDLYNIRVGSDEYARANESYGLTTLKSMHVKHIKGDDAEGRHDVVFSFTGKSGKDWDITIEDDHLVDLILKTNRLVQRTLIYSCTFPKLETKWTSRPNTSTSTFVLPVAWVSPPRISALGRPPPVVQNAWPSFPCPRLKPP